MAFGGVAGCGLPSGRCLSFGVSGCRGRSPHTSRRPIKRLATPWAEHFAHRAVQPHLLEQALDRHSIDLQCADLCPPTVNDIARVLKFGRSSAPGRGGIPLRCWRLLPRGAHHLHDVLCLLLSGVTPTFDWNYVIGWFPPRNLQLLTRCLAPFVVPKNFDPSLAWTALTRRLSPL